MHPAKVLVVSSGQEIANYVMPLTSEQIWRRIEVAQKDNPQGR
jgi:hypothetical protein